MPLTKRQFELGIDQEIETWMRHIYDFLSGHRDLAYSYRELLQVIPGGSEEETKISRALDVLDGMSAVQKRAVGYSDYYAFLQEFDTTSWQRKVRV
jgi:hypothetical protein